MNLETLLGFSNGIAIVVSVALNDLIRPLATVELAYDYYRNTPPGWPWTPAGDYIPTNMTARTPVTIPAGAIVTVTKPEADALVAAGVLAE